MSPGAKTVLVLCASGVILLCYLSYLVALLLLALLLATEFVLMLAAARFGLAGVMVNAINRHVPLLQILFRSFWLSKGTDYLITIQPAEAPKLFHLLGRLCTRLQIAPPDEVSIEMNSGAWVQLLGYRRGAGRTVLGIGYDLLASLSISEVEAVMAHEMSHAKLVQRGLKHGLNGGLARTVRVAQGFAELVEAQRQAKIDSTTTKLCLRCASILASLAARLVARYSRQDEFEADRGAAELCGADPLRTSLMKLEALDEKLSRLPWPERVAQLQLDGSFSQWLVTELALPPPVTTESTKPRARDPFSTHPSLHDRIAALPPTRGHARDGTSAITLLTEPDRIAERLMTEIQRVNAEQEQKDTRSLAKWTRKTLRSRSSHIQLAQLPALLLFVAALFVGLASLADWFNWFATLAALVLFGGGLWTWKLGAYKDKRSLPIPSFTALRTAWMADRPADVGAQETQLEADLLKHIGTEKKKRLHVPLLLDEAYAALGRCDYLRAHVALRLALLQKKNSIDASLGMSVAAAALNLNEQSSTTMNFVRERTGIRTPATIWGTAWALTLLGDRDRAEALLWRALEKTPDHPTLLLLLAFNQLGRHKLQSAALNAGKAVALAPYDLEAAKLYAKILLEAGRSRDADKLLAPFEGKADADPEFSLLLVRLRLLQRKAEVARQWAATLRRQASSAHWLIALGDAFETARLDDEATRHFHDALAAGYFPEAHLALGRLALNRRDKAAARSQFLTTLNLEKTLAPKANGPLRLLHAALPQLVQLEEPREGCRAWVVTFPPNLTSTPLAPFARCSLMVYAPDQAAAYNYLEHLLDALTPGNRVTTAVNLRWQPAPPDQQPLRPVRPGVQYVL